MYQSMCSFSVDSECSYVKFTILHNQLQESYLLAAEQVVHPLPAYSWASDPIIKQFEVLLADFVETALML